MEKLEGVRVLTDRDTFTVMEVKTDKHTHTVRLPYIVRISKEKEIPIRTYNVNVLDFCRIKGIATSTYFPRCLGKEEDDE